jgi:hypothetical protein
MDKWLLEHQTDIIIAAILAVIFAIIFGLIIAIFFEAFGIGSRIRDSIRRAKNNSAARSMNQLRKRIADQEAYRNSIASDSGLIIVLIRTMFVTLLSLTVCLGCMLIRSAFTFIGPGAEDVESILNFAGFGFLALALIGALSGIRLANIDTKEKADATIQKLDGEIARMRDKMASLEKRITNP